MHDKQVMAMYTWTKELLAACLERKVTLKLSKAQAGTDVLFGLRVAFSNISEVSRKLYAGGRYLIRAREFQP